MRSKYGAKKTVIDGIKFDSKVEAQYYSHFLKEKQAGLIKSFELQPEFVIFDGFTDRDGKKHRSIKYRADFLLVYPDGSMDVVDVKGVKTPVYQMKKKMFLQRYPQYRFVEVT
jgi:hypothetical protein